MKSRCEPCGLWSKGNRPLRDAEEHRARFELRRARHNAHATFDRLWQEGHLAREAAYMRLAQELGIAPELCHMSLMDTETARRVPAAVRAIRASLSRKSDIANADMLSNNSALAVNHTP